MDGGGNGEVVCGDGGGKCNPNPCAGVKSYGTGMDQKL